MAYVHPGLSSLSPQGAGPRLWSYDSGADNRAAVVASGYFNLAALDLKVRDVIFVDASDHPVIVAVAAISGSNVVTTTRLDSIA